MPAPDELLDSETSEPESYHNYAADLESVTHELDTEDIERPVLEAREAGEAEVVVAIQAGLRTAIMYDTKTNLSDGGAREYFVDWLVGEGLARELAAAYPEVATSGVVDDRGVRSPVDLLSITDRRLVEFATGQSYNEQFEPQGEISDLAFQKAVMPPRYWLRVGALHPDDPQIQQRALLKAYFKMQSDNNYNRERDPHLITGFVDNVAERMPDLADKTKGFLRRMRNIGTDNVSVASLAPDIDLAMAQAVQQGDMEFAGILMTPSAHETDRIESVLAKLELGDEEREELRGKLGELHRQKLDAYHQDTDEHAGISDDVRRTLHEILKHAGDPASAAEVPAEFWERVGELPDSIVHAFVRSQASLKNIAEYISIAREHGVLDRYEMLEFGISTLTEHADKEAYAISAGQVEFDPEDSSSVGRYKYLVEFQDPAAALEHARRFFGVDNAAPEDAGPYIRLRAAYLPGAGHAGLLQLDPEQTAFLEQAGPLLEEHGLAGPEWLTTVASAIMDNDHRSKQRERVLAALAELEGAPNLEDGLAFVAKAANPRNAVEVWKEFSGPIMELSRQLRWNLLTDAGRMDEPRAFVELFLAKVAVLRARRVYPEDSSLLLFTRAMSQLEAGRPEDLEGVAVDEVADNYHVSHEIEARMRPAFAAAIEQLQNIDPALQDAEGPEDWPDMTGPTKKEDPFEDLPEVKAIFARLGVPDALANRMYSAWATYDSVDFVERRHHKKLRNFGSYDIDRSVQRKIDVIQRQLGAMQDFVKEYGVEELVQINEIFGTLNFARYTPGYLHEQLERWNNPDEVVKSVAFTAHLDHNGAFGGPLLDDKDESTKKFRDDDMATKFGPEGLFCFEGGSFEDARRAAVRVAQRERRAGRQPDVKTAVIYGHANPRGIHLGFRHDGEGRRVVHEETGGRIPEGITVKSLESAYENHTKVQLVVQQLLGPNCRFIFSACSAGGVPKPLEGDEHQGVRRNLGETFSIVYGLRVDASPVVSYGFIVEPNGDVMYEGRDEQNSREMYAANVYVP
ncbi:MAG TPA: hypothetical protein VHQ86_01725 [Candidatus Saccharimonadia bacterium]|nr:hypothetical protein [Candidatus Saccharimonadia bacterium]